MAFDHLGALAAVSSARLDNGASLGVSRRIGYTDNGVSLNDSGSGLVELQHMRLTLQQWRAAGHGSQVTVDRLTPCLPWFGR
jgi:RimJ/RimL family protein N-acetyltransferase